MTLWIALLAMVVVAFLGAVGGFLYWRLSYFLRDPKRNLPEGEDKIVASADGFITYVKWVDQGQIPIAVKDRKNIPIFEYSGLDCGNVGYLIGTYMTEYSFHRNRVPISGDIVFRQHRSAAPFNYTMARMTANLLFRRIPYDEGCNYLLTNERLTIGIRHASGALVFVTQIADLWINRIVARVVVGDKVHRGEQYGLIRLGSQCDVFLPIEIVDNILVEPGQYVLAGETVLALMNTKICMQR
jgi:phosphatidylserine decarboxylase